MNVFSNISPGWVAVFLACLVEAGWAQQAAVSCNANIINATGIEIELAMPIHREDGKVENVVISLAERSCTGHFSHPAGHLDLVLRPKNANDAETIKPGGGRLELKAGTMNALAVHLVFEKLRNSREEDKPAPVFKLKRVEHPSTARGFALGLLSLCRETKSFQVGTRATRIEPGETRVIDGWRGSGFQVNEGAVKVLTVGHKSEPDPFMLVFYQKLDGSTQGLQFRYESRN